MAVEYRITEAEVVAAHFDGNVELLVQLGPREVPLYWFELMIDRPRPGMVADLEFDGLSGLEVTVNSGKEYEALQWLAQEVDVVNAHYARAESQRQTNEETAKASVDIWVRRSVGEA